MVQRFLWVVISLVLVVHAARASNEIVVLTKTPVAEFTLPDGSVLKNAFMFRRSSAGMMIIHDEGNYFLNFKLLPADWKEAYTGEKPAPPPIKEPEPVVVLGEDRYGVREILKDVPQLDPAGYEILLKRDLPEMLDQGVLVLGVMQGLLSKEKDLATRCMLFIEEKGYEIEGVSRELLFEPCLSCEGAGRLERNCNACDGSGECPKCESEAERKSKLNKTGKRRSSDNDQKDEKTARDECRVCDGTGVCRKCEGAGAFSPLCQKCRGAGKTLNVNYCELMRNKWVRMLNAAIAEQELAPVTVCTTSGMQRVLESIKMIPPEVTAFYFSDVYTGAMDTNLVLACVMKSFVKENLPLAKRFITMMTVEYPNQTLFVVEDYLTTCSDCEATGKLVVECPSCHNSGECVECGGSGEYKHALSRLKSDCSVCEGTGECPVCAGEGQVTVNCGKCGGSGRLLQKKRAEVRLELVTDDLKLFYLQQSEKDASSLVEGESAEELAK